MEKTRDYPSLKSIQARAAIGTAVNIFNFVTYSFYGVLADKPAFEVLGALSGLAAVAVIDLAKPQIIEARKSEERIERLKKAGFSPKI